MLPCKPVCRVERSRKHRRLGEAGRAQAEPAGRVQAEARQRRQRGEGPAGEPGSLAGQRRLQLAEERRQDPALIRASIPGRRAGNCAHGQHVLAPRAAGTRHRPPGPARAVEGTLGVLWAGGGVAGVGAARGEWGQTLLQKQLRGRKKQLK